MLPSRLVVTTTEEDAVTSLSYKQQGIPNGYFVSQGCLLGEALFRTYGARLLVGYANVLENYDGGRYWRVLPHRARSVEALVKRWCEAKPEPETNLKEMARKLKLVGRTVIFEEVTK